MSRRGGAVSDGEIVLAQPGKRSTVLGEKPTTPPVKATGKEGRGHNLGGVSVVRDSHLSAAGC